MAPTSVDDDDDMFQDLVPVVGANSWCKIVGAKIHSRISSSYKTNGSGRFSPSTSPAYNPFLPPPKNKEGGR